MGNAHKRAGGAGDACAGAPLEAQKAYDKLVRLELKGLARTSAQAALWLARGGVPGLPTGCETLLARLVGVFADNFTPGLSAWSNVARPTMEFAISDAGMAWESALGGEVMATVAAIAAMPFLNERDGPALSLVVQSLKYPPEWSVAPPDVTRTLFGAFAKARELEAAELRRLVAHFSVRGLAGGDATLANSDPLAEWGVAVEDVSEKLKQSALLGAKELWAKPASTVDPSDGESKGEEP